MFVNTWNEGKNLFFTAKLLYSSAKFPLGAIVVCPLRKRLIVDYNVGFKIRLEFLSLKEFFHVWKQR